MRKKTIKHPSPQGGLGWASIKHPSPQGGLGWASLHKWTGLLVCFFMLMTCISGLILNHRHMYSNVNVSRKFLYSRYQFHNWNNGLLRGTTPYHSKLLIYGAGGIFLTDSTGSCTTDFNNGLPTGADKCSIKSVVQTRNGEVFAVSRFALCHLCGNKWKPISAPSLPKPLLVGSSNDFTDLTTLGDSLVVVSRSKLYVAVPPYSTFKEIQLPRTADYDGKVSWFRMMWVLHNGEIYGLPTKILSDLMAIILILVSLTGIVFFLSRKKQKKLAKYNFIWHNRLGKWTIILTLFVTLTGWFLRPPFLIALVKCNTPALPGSELSTDNQWQDRLRMLRWDEGRGEWLLSTADGMYSMKSLTSQLSPLSSTPPISVMGLNTFTREDGYWVVGSFSGIYAWDSKSGVYEDLITGDVTYPDDAPQQAGPPIGLFSCSGYSHDFKGEPVIVNYSSGTSLIPQPSTLNHLPISLWNLALELHNGRLYPFCGGLGSMLYIFIFGLLTFLCLLSGYLRRKK